jgi:hypothetical protein
MIPKRCSRNRPAELARAVFGSNITHVLCSASSRCDLLIPDPHINFDIELRHCALGS